MGRALFAAVYLLVTVGAIEVGAVVRRQGRSEWWALLALLPPAAGAAALAVAAIASDVTLGSAIGGVLLAACGVALAVCFYYLLGRYAGRAWMHLVGWLALLVPSYGYLLLLLIFVASLTSCTPDDYECPV